MSNVHDIIDSFRIQGIGAIEARYPKLKIALCGAFRLGHVVEEASEWFSTNMVQGLLDFLGLAEQSGRVLESVPGDGFLFRLGDDIYEFDTRERGWVVLGQTEGEGNGPK